MPCLGANVGGFLIAFVGVLVVAVVVAEAGAATTGSGNELIFFIILLLPLLSEPMLLLSFTLFVTLLPLLLSSLELHRGFLLLDNKDGNDDESITGVTRLLFKEVIKPRFLPFLAFLRKFCQIASDSQKKRGNLRFVFL